MSAKALAIAAYLTCGVIYGELLLSAAKALEKPPKSPLWRLWMFSVLLWPLCVYGEVRGRFN